MQHRPILEADSTTLTLENVATFDIVHEARSALPGDSSIWPDAPE